MSSLIKIARQCEHCAKDMPVGVPRRRHPQTDQRVCSGCQETNVPDWANTKVAHDGGGNSNPRHCPFCGSGAIIGGGDGTIECGYCDSYFTVRVQPKNNGAPQSPPIDDEGVWEPGVQDEVPFGEEEDDPFADDGEDDPFADEVDEESDTPFDEDEIPSSENEEDSDPFSRTSRLAVQSLPEREYERYLSRIIHK